MSFDKNTEFVTPDQLQNGDMIVHRPKEGVPYAVSVDSLSKAGKKVRFRVGDASYSFYEDANVRFERVTGFHPEFSGPIPEWGYTRIIDVADCYSMITRDCKNGARVRIYSHQHSPGFSFSCVLYTPDLSAITCVTTCEYEERKAFRIAEVWAEYNGGWAK